MLSTGGGTSDPMADSRGGANVACDTAAEKFACNVFGSTHQVWSQIVSGYQRPTLNFFTDRNQSGCGAAQAAMGPFYCPRSEEHTSELQSLMRISYAVFCLKKKKSKTTHNNNSTTTQQLNQQDRRYARHNV